MSGKARWLGIAAAVPVVLSASGCEWFTDFKRQPSLWTWEAVKDSTTPSRGSPQYSVPVTGTAMPGFQVSYAALPATIDSMAGIPNPTPVSDASLINGRKYFQINCAVCHGEKAMGDGPATQFGMPGINLTTDVTRARTDGYIFGMIRNGRGLMPPYNRIEEPDRWDVVNYLRGLQGSLGRTVPTGPLAAPGVTGDKVPGVTRTAPTRQAPFVKPGTAAAFSAAPPSAAQAPAVAIPETAAAPGNQAGTTTVPRADTAAGAKRDSAKRDSAKRDSAGRAGR